MNTSGEPVAPSSGKPALATNLAPDTGKPLSVGRNLRFAVGFALVSILWALPFFMGASVLLPHIFDGMKGVSPEGAIGLVNSISSIFSLLANIVFGALSDMSRFKVGKRTPWIVLGGVIAAVGYLLAFNTQSLALIVVAWCVVQVGLNCIIAPAVAVLSDRIPELTRGTFSALYGAGAIVGQQLGTFVGSFFLSNTHAGGIVGTVIFLFSGIIVVLIWPREQSAAENAAKVSAADIARSFIPPTKNCRDFYLALGGRLVFVIGTFMISGYQLFILQKYIHLSLSDARTGLQVIAVITVITTIGASAISGPLSDFLHRRKIIVAASTVLFAIGLAVPIFMPTVTGMYIYAALAGIANGCYMSVDQALNVDVLPNPDEAGKDLGILNLANTLGQILAPVFTTRVIAITGGYKMVFPVAIVFLLVGAFFIMTIRKVK
ncbi:transporter [Bifidobacterium actinocoloniiforme DSM 22766]|nr:transporter [Bifidobacterium actinocoloniiforme DSM 22766]